MDAAPRLTTMIDEIAFDERGLAPCVIQDAGTGEVLTLAWVNAEALERTIATGEMHLWSRSRDELWRKGETSGNVQRVRELRYDCDADAVLALVDPTGPACHTGERTCFFRAADGAPQPVAHEALPALEAAARSGPPQSHSVEASSAGRPPTEPRAPQSRPLSPYERRSSSAAVLLARESGREGAPSTR